MRIQRGLAVLLALLCAPALAVPAAAQQQTEPPAQAPAAHPPDNRTAKPKPPATAKPPAATATEAKPTLLAQYAEWGAYTASPGGKKVCFTIARPTTAETRPPNRPRNQPYLFVTTRPTDKVTNEISIAIGYPFKSGSKSTVQIGQTTYVLYTEGDGAWIKNAAEEARMVEDMRAGETAVVKGVSSHGTQTIDTYSLKGLSQALDRVAEECK